MLKETITDVLQSLQTTIVTHPKDWSLYKRDCWIYGVLVGWDFPYEDRPEGLSACSREDYQRMQRYRQIVKAQKGDNS